MLTGNVSHAIFQLRLSKGIADIAAAGESGGKAMSRIYGNIGFKGLWNGLPVRIVMIGRHEEKLLIRGLSS